MATHNEQANKRTFVRRALTWIALDAGDRAQKLASRLPHSLVGTFALLPALARADGNPDIYGYPQLKNTTAPSYAGFVATPVDANNTDGAKVLADVNNFVADGIDWHSFQARADQIRKSGTREYCIGNLSVALAGVGAAYQASAAGATTLLTLLPTAGALIGTPVTELWVLYKLMPMAGVVSMLLSLGGNIVPTDVNDYEKVTADFNYSGMIGVDPDKQKRYDRSDLEDDEDEGPQTARVPLAPGYEEAEKFAREVAARAKDTKGSRKTGVIYTGIAIEIVLLGFIMFACWFMQSGSIVVWWCDFWPWMYFWYGFVALTSLLENLAGVPFTRQWTIRVSRAPKVRISPDAPWVIPSPESPRRSRHTSGMMPRHRSGMMSPNDQNDPNDPNDPNDITSNGKGPATFADEIAYQGHQLLQSDQSGSGSDFGGFYPSRYSSIPQPNSTGEILHGFEKGYNTHGKVVMDPNEPWSAASDAFYVIISVRGVSHPHAVLRVFSKIMSIGVYTVGTALFASSTLTTIMVAVVVASLVIIAGVFGRVTAMWMVSELMKNRPFLHKVAKDRADAERYIEAMLRKPNMVFEVLGHVITDGRCIKRYNKRLRWSKLLGVLANPYDITRLAVPNHHYSKA